MTPLHRPRKMATMSETHAECPFCPNGMKAREILYENEFWLVIRNQRGYKGTREHLLIVLKQHLDAMTHLYPEPWWKLQECIEFCTNNYGEGGWFCRRGGMNLGSTQTHYHVHYTIPKNGHTVFAHFGSDLRHR